MSIKVSKLSMKTPLGDFHFKTEEKEETDYFVAQIPKNKEQIFLPKSLKDISNTFSEKITSVLYKEGLLDKENTLNLSKNAEISSEDILNLMDKVLEKINEHTVDSLKGESKNIGVILDEKDKAKRS